ncbi:MAG: hypothetical protein ACRD3S_18405 [Terracidiphilus sp.]
MIDLIGEPECRHAFHVFGPTLTKLDQGLRGRCRPQPLASFEVPQQRRGLVLPIAASAFAMVVAMLLLLGTLHLTAYVVSAVISGPGDRSAIRELGMITAACCGW